CKSSKMASPEEDFPRGGISKKISGSKPVVQHVEADNLFQTCETAENKKKRKSIKQGDGKDAKKQKIAKEESLKLNAAKTVDILHLKNIKVGTLILGCVKEVTDFEVVISLPSGITGFLPVTNLSEAYRKMLCSQLDLDDDTEEIFTLPYLFPLGMLVRCVVSSLGTTKTGHISLKLSIDPKLVNSGLNAGTLKAGMVLSGCVESIEDHGFLVDIGLSGTRAFLAKPEANQCSAKQAELKVGQYVTCLLEEVKNNGRIVRVSMNPATVAQTFATAEHGWTLSSLLPGLLVNAEIKKVTKNGLVLEFLSSFTGTVDFLNMDPERAESYSPGDKLKACVLYVEPSTRSVGLSLLTHLFKPGCVVEPVFSERVGEVVEGCRLKCLHSASGAILELPEKTVAFVHRNYLQEANESFSHNKIISTLSHVCRIMDFSPLEQMHTASLRRSIIDTPFLRYQDIRPGQLLEGTVLSVQPSGVIVKVTDHIRGLVPSLHVADVVLKNPEKKYSVGKKVKCRVLLVEPPSRKLLLTRKKALLDSTLPLIRSYAEARVGKVSHGYVVCVKDFGCIVRFYGNVKGLVPLQELTAEPVVDPQQLFYVGQVVKTKVLSCNAEQEKLLLSFKAAMGPESDSMKEHLQEFNFEIGTKVEARIVKKLLDVLQMSILPEESPALLPRAHLSDHVSNCSLLWEALREGDVVSNAVCLSKSKSNAILTKKPIVAAALEDGFVARDFSDLQVGMQLVGWVKNIMPYGVFVEFPYGLVALAPKSAISDMFVTSTEGIFQIGQTLLTKVTNLDEEKRRVLVSLKVSDVSSGEEDSLGRLLHGLQERTAMVKMMSSRADLKLPEFLCSLTLGQKLKVTVGTVKEDGSVTFVGDELPGVTVVAKKYHVTGVKVAPGEKVTVVVLHVDLLALQVHVSLIPELVGKKKHLETGSTLPAAVRYLEEEFAVISLADKGHLTVVHTTAHLNESFRFKSQKLAVGSSLSVIVKDSSCEELGGLPLVLRAALAEGAQGPTLDGSAKPYRIGNVVTGTVKAIRPLSILVSLPDNVKGSIHVSQIKDVVSPGSYPTSTVKKGSTVTAKVIGTKDVAAHNYLPISHPAFKFTVPELTMLPSVMEGNASLQGAKMMRKLKRYRPGDEITCYVSKYNMQKKYLEVEVSPFISGVVDLLLMTLDHKETFASHSDVCPCPAAPTGVYSLSTGAVTLGIVRKVVAHSGLAVSLPFGRSGFVSLLDLADSYRPNPLETYLVGTIVRCCVIGEDDGSLQLSLRPSRVKASSAPPVRDVEVLSIDDLKEGQIVRGYVKSVGDSGVFIRLSRSITGLARYQQLTTYFVKDHSVYAKHIQLSGLYTTKVVSVNKEKGHVELSLLPQDTGKPDVLPESLGLPLRLGRKENKGKRKRAQCESKQVPGKNVKKTDVKSDENDSGVEVFFREEEKQDKSRKVCRAVEGVEAQPVRLHVPGGFSWDASLSSLRPATAAKDEDSSDEEEAPGQPRKKSKKDRELEKQQEEKRLSQLENELMDPNLQPRSANAFERLVLSSPDSSLVWLQYMAFHLQATEIEQARAVAERALKTISFREEQEKLNVWVALLNLENLYGSEDSLHKVFERALQYCEPLPVYQQLADIYTTSNKHKEAEMLYKNMVKRFSQDRAVWLSYATFLLKQGQNDSVHALLQRALKSLPNKEHVDLIAKFAQLEFKYGDVERGKSMFDRTLSNYPKRTDLWSIYIDLMIKHGTQKEVRELFDRVIHLSVAVKRIKFFFKRYLEYEKKNGTPESVQAVKEKALQYVEAKGSAAAS
ncbi:protein RRP5-like, partial [Scleropages formosus]